MNAAMALQQEDAPKRPTCRMIIELVALETGVCPRLITGDSRVIEVVRARHLAIWLCHQTTGQSSVRIGRAFGDRDHSTVLAAIKGCAAKRLQDLPLRSLSDRLLTLIQGAAA